MIHAISQAHRCEGFLRPLTTLTTLHPAVRQRQFDIGQGRRARDEVEGLEDEADAVIAHDRQLVVVQITHVEAVEEIATAGGDIEGADDVHESRLARTGCTHDGDVFAVLDRQIHTVEGPNLGITASVDLADVLQLDDDRHR